MPVITRQDACQTCFMCEAWCPTDALFVAPQTSPVPANSLYRDEGWLIEQGLLRSYRREIGWANGRREDPEKEGLSPLFVEPLGLENRRAPEEGVAQHDIGFSVAYSDEGEEADEPSAPTQERAA